MFAHLTTIFSALQDNGVKNPLYETLRVADLALNGVLGKSDLATLELDGNDLNDLAEKRAAGIPLEYIIGKATFMGLLLECSPDTLIPREETELLAKVTLDYISQMQEHSKELTIIDMGTGCGNIAVSLAVNSENTRIFASDLSPEAIEVARRNVDRFNLQSRVLVSSGDLFSPFHGSGIEAMVDIIVCNPPYLPTSTLDKLAPEIIDHEPVLALDAGTYGLAIFRRLIAEALTFLRPQGVLVFEIGVGQDRLVNRLLSRNPGYEDIDCFDDGQDVRVMSAVKKG